MSTGSENRSQLCISRRKGLGWDEGLAQTSHVDNARLNAVIPKRFQRPLTAP